MIPTIFAPATAPGRGGVAIVRVSGPRAGVALTILTARPLPAPRTATVVRLADPRSGEFLDQGVVLWFPGPRSFTGEDVAEFHVHGGRAVVAGLIDSLSALQDFRIAEPGEFSRRGFENGKFDLTAAEAIADLVDAETSAQRRQALRQMEGELGRLYEDWRRRLTHALAHLEADIDFPDEDLPEGVSDQVRPVLESLITGLRAHLDDKRRGERLRDGIHIAILGAPNAGKSSLLNALARREAAIVSERAGTTRDVVEVHLDLGGYPVVLADTAGLREAADEIESEGIRRALARAAQADLKLAVFDATSLPDLDAQTLEIVDEDTLVVLNKSDRVASPEMTVGGRATLAVSAVTGSGLAELLEKLTAGVARRFEAPGVPALTRARHRSALEECVASLERALSAPLPELAAEDVRIAIRALGRITGRVDVEDLLDVIFRDFCIGK
ncbi:tRNA uridine-5-carboxymethylaminomethyl(34) synthesis GTPase MnmE [Skermanella mucosa]|uniref:tRNA uridine-5-carboxymethylaminomethyl(34) synthesis GTPase MnmE n=1 Tax=Skermanella mucosa TaxID=1789672 RepID=UPI00192AEC27|nr:tRNA uridine-5-carboxymethylaminomethyl(34) synthesis GTPase MnmE [Skermanella mucosa]UEM21008.1 tRNA uridine-5-carboxymethylaminomethyl(34) synthesis GTPase MnmE [Skermanella mucosa]